MSKFELKPGLNDCTNEEYHSDKKYLSSSSLKLLLENKQEFYEQYILGRKTVQPDNTAFLFGSYMHSLILEPNLVSSEYVVAGNEFNIRRGEEYEKFKRAHPGKKVITSNEDALARELLTALANRPLASELLEDGLSEHTACVEIGGVKLKSRADYINVNEGYIVDVKTTSNATDRQTVIQTNEQFHYPLSAALYCLVFEAHYGKPFDFYWVFLSKFKKTCDVYKMSEKTKAAGRAQVEKALEIYRRAVESSNWHVMEIEEV